MAAILIVLIVIAVVTIFSVQNANPVTISFLVWKFEASLAIVVFLVLMVGIIIGATIASFFRIKHRSVHNQRTGV